MTLQVYRGAIHYFFHMPLEQMAVNLAKKVRESGKTPNRVKFLRDFSNEALEKQLDLLRGDIETPVLDGVLSFEQGIPQRSFSRVGGSGRIERSCEMSSSSYLKFDWTYFITPERSADRRVYFEGEIVGEDILRLRLLMATKRNVAVRNHGGMYGFFNIDRYKTVMGAVQLTPGFQGYALIDPKQRKPYVYVPPLNLAIGLNDGCREQKAKLLQAMKDQK